jgi:hypothetical protein
VLALPVLVSAAFCYYSWLRLASLVACVAAVGWLITYGPADLLGFVIPLAAVVVVLEWVSRMFWYRLRTFPEPSSGNLLARPMRGWEFEFALTSGPDKAPAPSAVGRVLLAVVALCLPALLVCGLLPRHALGTMEAKGARYAEADWESGELRLRRAPGGQVLWTNRLAPYREGTGGIPGLLRDRNNAGYRDEMNRIVQRTGLVPVTSYLFVDDELEALLRSGRWLAVRASPLRYGQLTVGADGQLGGDLGGGLAASRLQYALVAPEKSGALVTLSAGELRVRQPDGRLLQTLWAYRGRDLTWDIDAIRSSGTWRDR